MKKPCFVEIEEPIMDLKSKAYYTMAPSELAEWLAGKRPIPGGPSTGIRI